MAEYIEFHCPHGDDFEGGDECDRCEKYELCMETPKADVVERSKYESIRKQLLQSIDEKFALDKANRNLRSKIDKAIEEINHLTIYYKTTQGSELVSRKAVLRTINKYLGE